MKKLLLILMVLCVRLNAQTFDSTTSVTDNSVPYTLTGVTVGSFTNRILIGGVSQRAPQINNVTGSVFNTSETMAKLTSLNGNSGSNLNVSVWYLLAPTVTTASIVPTSSNTGTVVIGSLSAYGVNQSAPFRDQGGANFLSTAVSATTTASVTLTTVPGDLCVAVYMAGNNAANVTNLVPGGSATERWDANLSPTTDARGGGSTLVATTTSTVMSFSWTNNEFGVLIAFALTPSATAGPLFKRYYDQLRSQ